MRFPVFYMLVKNRAEQQVVLDFGIKCSNHVFDNGFINGFYLLHDFPAQLSVCIRTVKISTADFESDRSLVIYSFAGLFMDWGILSWNKSGSKVGETSKRCLPVSSPVPKKSHVRLNCVVALSALRAVTFRVTVLPRRFINAP